MKPAVALLAAGQAIFNRSAAKGGGEALISGAPWVNLKATHMTV